jgi:hypothetical protein
MCPTLFVIMRAGAVWLLILVLAFLNRAARELFLIPRLGRAPGLFLSGILLSTLILAVALATVRWMRLRSTAEAWAIGGFWLAATLIFEFGLGWAQGKPVRELLEAYTFRDGNTWSLVVLAMVLAPRLGFQCAGRLGAGP